MSNFILTNIEQKELVNELAEAIVAKLNPVKEKEVDREELLQTHQVMKLLGKSRTTIKNWRDLGLIKHQVINSRVYFKRSDILNAGLHIDNKRNKRFHKQS